MRGPRVFLTINYFHSTPTSLGSVQTYHSFYAFTLLTDVLLFRPRPSIILFSFLRLLFCYDAILIRTYNILYSLLCDIFVHLYIKFIVEHCRQLYFI
jgi:hypothetical protein